MKTRYRVLARRKLEAARRLRGDRVRSSRLDVNLEDPMEMSPELIDLATGQLLPYGSKRGKVE